MDIMELLQKTDEQIADMSTDFPEIETDIFSTRSPKKLARELLASEKAKSIYSSVEYSPIFSIFTVYRRATNDERVYYVVSNGRCWRRIWTASEAAFEIARRVIFFGNRNLELSAQAISRQTPLRDDLLDLLKIPLNNASQKEQIIEKISKCRFWFPKFNGENSPQIYF